MSDSDRTVEACCIDMLRLIRAYQDGMNTFEGIVNGLEQRINSMIGFADPEWLNEVRSIWGQLEVVYALMLDEGREGTSIEERRAVDETLEELTALISPYD